MIKKFEAFEKKPEIDRKRFASFFREAFIDFIDEDKISIHDIDDLFGAIICLPNDNGEEFHLNDISDIISKYKQEIEVIEEIKVAILRIKDEFGIEPDYMKIYFSVYKIEYEFEKKSSLPF